MCVCLYVHVSRLSSLTYCAPTRFDGANKKSFPVASFMPKFVALRKHYNSFIEYARSKSAQLSEVEKPKSKAAAAVRKAEPSTGSVLGAYRHTDAHVQRTQTLP